jgi:hypothetical protein
MGFLLLPRGKSWVDRWIQAVPFPTCRLDQPDVKKVTKTCGEILDATAVPREEGIPRWAFALGRSTCLDQLSPV